MSAAALAAVPSAEPTTIGADRLRSFIQRIEKLEDDKANVLADMKEVYAEAKGEGYDVKVMRKLVRIIRADRQKRLEEEEILDIYKSALGIE